MIAGPEEKSLRIKEKRRINPRSLANLKLGQFKKGESGNPAGRPSAGLTVKEFMNEMQGWTKQQLLDVMANEASPVNRIAAARLWFDACSDSNELDRILDRTTGKPQQAIDVTSNGETILAPIKLDGDREL